MNAPLLVRRLLGVFLKEAMLVGEEREAWVPSMISFYPTEGGGAALRQLPSCQLIMKEGDLKQTSQGTRLITSHSKPSATLWLASMDLYILLPACKPMKSPQSKNKVLGSGKVKLCSTP